MPRSARLDAPGVLNHVTIRGIRSRSIFKDDRDRENFLERLGKLLQETRTACYAWALLPDHAHKKRPWQDVGFVLHSFGKSAGPS